MTKEVNKRKKRTDINKEIKKEVSKEVDEAEKDVKKSLSQKVKREIDKKLSEAQKEVNSAVRKAVNRKVEREVDEVHDEVDHEIKREVTKQLKKHFDIIGKFRMLKTHNKLLFATIVGIGVVSFWRGVWLFIDLAIFPEHPWFRSAVSTLFGLTILAATGALIEVFENVNN